jgi:hypothetical protein
MIEKPTSQSMAFNTYVSTEKIMISTFLPERANMRGGIFRIQKNAIFKL